MTESAGRGPWWRDAVCYEVYVRSFADSDGDGLGDLAGVRQRLDHLAWLGVDALWLTPFYPSPQRDGGYDVADYRDVDRRFGTLRDLDALVKAAHRRDLRVIVDIVPNHTSSDHSWFREALAARPGSRARRRYVFADGRGHDGSRPPNNWLSKFGGSAWTRVEDGQWYLHLFDASQPDLNWRNREVAEEFDSILRFWLDRGVDGFRVDVAHGLFKARDLPDSSSRGHDTPFWNQPEVHRIFRRWHRILAEYPGDRMAIGEAWTSTPEIMARYIRHDELQQVFNFAWLLAPWSATAFRRVIEQTYRAVGPSKASPTWVLSNHDVTRAVTRYGGGSLGVRRNKAALLAMLALPGSAYLYQGEELGLPEVEVPPARRRDPTWLRGGGIGRDGCRVPIPWTAQPPSYGFGPAAGAAPWLPQPAGWRDLSVASQRDEPGSTLSLYRRALTERRRLLESGMVGDAVDLSASRRGLLVVRRPPGLICVLNSSSRAHRIDNLGINPDRLLIASADIAGPHVLPANAAAWFGPTV